MDYSYILNLILGTGIVGVLVKGYFDRRKDAATARKTETEADTVDLANQAAQLAGTLGYTKTLQDFVKETEANTAQIKLLTTRVQTLERENADLQLELKVKTGTIEYQREERHEWMAALSKLQEQGILSKLEITQLTDRVTHLEARNEELTKMELRTP